MLDPKIYGPEDWRKSVADAIEQVISECWHPMHEREGAILRFGQLLFPDEPLHVNNAPKLYIPGMIIALWQKWQGPTKHA